MKKGLMKAPAIFSVLVLSMFVTVLAKGTDSLAQSPSRRAVKFTGVVRDPRDAGIKNAAVTIEGRGLKLKLQTNEDGAFEIELPDGTYQFTIEKYGFMRLIVEDFRIKGATHISYNFNLYYGSPSDRPLDYNDLH